MQSNSARNPGEEGLSLSDGQLAMTKRLRQGDEGRERKTCFLFKESWMAGELVALSILGEFYVDPGCDVTLFESRNDNTLYKQRGRGRMRVSL